MNAPLNMELLMKDTVRRFLEGASVEITPKQADKIPRADKKTPIFN